MKVCTDASLFGAWVANTIKNDQSVNRILDIGTGTGLLSLMLAQQSPAQIDAIDIEEAAAMQATENVQSSPWLDRIAVIHQSIQEWMPGTRYDLIISNPPFFEQDLVSPDEKKNLARHSAQLSMSELLDQVASRLSANGKAYILIPHAREQELLEKAMKRQLYPTEIVAVSQTDRHGYFRSMIILSPSAVEPVRTNIQIKDETGKYTAQFSELLKEYYLFL